MEFCAGNEEVCTVEDMVWQSREREEEEEEEGSVTQSDEEGSRCEGGWQTNRHMKAGREKDGDRIMQEGFGMMMMMIKAKCFWHVCMQQGLEI